MIQIAVLGAGSWGSAMALAIAKKGLSCRLYMRNSKQCQEIQRTRINQRYLPGHILPVSLEITDSLEEALSSAQLVLTAVPSQQLRSLLEQAKPFIGIETILINLSKGIEVQSGLRMSEVAACVLPYNPFAALSGPSHAEEVAAQMPTALVCASAQGEIARKVQQILSGEALRLYTNADLTGVELGGALKNIIALGIGIIDGLGFGDNTKAALMTRGLTEITRLGNALGALPLTFSGLSGIGDLIVTCTSLHSRNRRAGVLIGQGHSVQQAVEEVGMVVEGLSATKAAYRLASAKGVEMPITAEIHRMLTDPEAHISESVGRLMNRSLTLEMEQLT